MSWTPRQLMARLHFIDRDTAIDQASMLNLVRIAMHAKDKDAKEFMQELLGEG